ncbi:MAG: hypothetical protein WAN86_07345 [Hyphomicrobiaceae bacterium]
MSRKSLFALGAAALMMMIGSLSWVAGPAQAHSRHRACVTADHGAWLFADRCHRRSRHCWKPARKGRAFRVLRQEGGYLLVRNLQARGWIELHSVRFAPWAYCRAAGI